MIEILKQPLTTDIKKQIHDGFSRHAIEMTGFDERFEPVAFVAMDGNDLAGVVVVALFWGALHVRSVYVAEGYRGQGLASELMGRVLEYGLENKCPFAFVETMNFQAQGFYQKIGFKLEFTRHGYAHGTSFHYLRKDLA